MAIADTSDPGWDLIGWGQHPRAQHGKGWSKGHSNVPSIQPATVDNGGRWTALITSGMGNPKGTSRHLGHWISIQVTNIYIYNIYNYVYKYVYIYMFDGFRTCQRPGSPKYTKYCSKYCLIVHNIPNIVLKSIEYIYICVCVNVSEDLSPHVPNS